MDILLICYNRPEYVKKVLDSLKFIKDIDNLFISVDAPKNDDFNDKILVERTIEIINEYKFANKYVSYNQVKLGCKKHVHFALKWVNDNVDNENLLFVLEDDILLNENTQKRIDLSENYKDQFFVLKFNRYFWGWISNKKTIEVLIGGLKSIVSEYDSIKNDITNLTDFKNKYNFKDVNQLILELEPFSKNIYVPWDEEYPIIMKFNNILDISCKKDEYYTDNIGVISSRDNNLEPTYNNSNNLRFYVENGNIVYY